MPRHERHSAAGHRADDQRVARRSERGVDRYLVGGAEKLIQPGAADDADAGQVGHAGQATFEPDDEEDDDEPEDEDDEPEDEEPTVSPDFLPLPPDLSPDDPDDPDDSDDSDDPEEDEESPVPLSDFLPSDPDPFDEAAAGSAFFWLARLSVR
jgi:hypothetical protein